MTAAALKFIAPPLLMGAAMSLACALVCGDSLLSFITVLAWATIPAAALALLGAGKSAALLQLALLWCGLLVGWLWIFATVRLPVAALAEAGLILLIWLLAVGGMARLLRRAGLSHVGAFALAAAAALLWLASPLWLSGTIDHPSAARLLTALPAYHPLLVLNGALPQLGNWTEMPLMYRLGRLNQDVPYALATHPWWMLIAHLPFLAGWAIKNDPLQSGSLAN